MNYYVSLLQKSKRGHYGNLNIKSVTDNKLFWKPVKRLLSPWKCFHTNHA